MVILTDTSEKSRIDAVDLALSVMSTLASSQGRSASELASQVGATFGLISGILQKLTDRSFVFKDPLGLYWLGPQLYYLGGHISERTALVHASVDTLEWIVADTHEGATVAMRENLEVVMATSRGSHELFALQPIANSRGPLGHGSAGKVMLAYAPQEIIDEVIDGHIDVFAPADVRTREDALGVLESIRRDGLYVALGESHPDVISIAAPVHNAHGRVVAALVVLCFREKCTDQHKNRLIEVTRIGAERISSHLG